MNLIGAIGLSELYFRRIRIYLKYRSTYNGESPRIIIIQSYCEKLVKYMINVSWIIQAKISDKDIKI